MLEIQFSNEPNHLDEKLSKQILQQEVYLDIPRKIVKLT